MDQRTDSGAARSQTRGPEYRIPHQPRPADPKVYLDDPIVAPPKPRRQRGPAPSRNDAVFRFGAAWFAVWVVSSLVTSPISNLRPSWWPIYLGVGVIIALSMLVGACMTVRDYLEHRRR